MAGASHSGNPDAAEHYYDDTLGFKRVLLYGTDGSGVAQPVSTDSSGNLQQESAIISDTPEFFEDTSFVTGDSPADIDINAALGNNSSKCSVVNDGPGNFTVAVSNDGAAFGDPITVKANEVLNLDGISVHTVRITWVSDSAYRVIAV